MATVAKPKVQSKQRKSPVDSDSKLNKKKNSEKKTTPTEEQIRRKAQEIYDQRNARGEYGTEVDDWRLAEKLLMED